VGQGPDPKLTADRRVAHAVERSAPAVYMSPQPLSNFLRPRMESRATSSVSFTARQNAGLDKCALNIRGTTEWPAAAADHQTRATSWRKAWNAWARPLERHFASIRGQAPAQPARRHRLDFTQAALPAKTTLTFVQPQDGLFIELFAPAGRGSRRAPVGPWPPGNNLHPSLFLCPPCVDRPAGLCGCSYSSAARSLVVGVDTMLPRLRMTFFSFHRPAQLAISLLNRPSLWKRNASRLQSTASEPGVVLLSHLRRTSSPAPHPYRG